MPVSFFWAFVRGMTAFGLEETGDYGAAMDAGRAAVAANPDDVWAIHAVVHTYEMQGRVDEGITFLRSDETRWESGNLFTVHNWWHLALYEMEAGRPERALAIYDAEVHHAASLGVPIEMLDASARSGRPASISYSARCHQLCTVNRFPDSHRVSSERRKAMPSSTRPCIS